ncbi:MAG: hypothetical protein IPK77_01885 [Cellvibrio sp.]|nr:hypothetical protein [Cellvibrio sp.]
MLKIRLAGKMRILELLIFTLVIASCSSLYKTAHQRFIDMMNSICSSGKSLDQLDFNPDYPLGRYLADHRDLTVSEVRLDGLVLYHYSKKMLTGQYICNYHLLVDPNTNIVVGWGFDQELGDPKKGCGIAG